MAENAAQAFALLVNAAHSSRSYHTVLVDQEHLDMYPLQFVAAAPSEPTSPTFPWFLSAERTTARPG